jgi:betaine lipid synthase
MEKRDKMGGFVESSVAGTPLEQLYSYLPHSVVNLTAVFTAFMTLLGLAAALSKKVRDILVFSYTCFLQPLGKTTNQAQRLDKFYQHQANGKLPLDPHRINTEPCGETRSVADVCYVSS